MKSTLLRIGFAILFCFLAATNYQQVAPAPEVGLWDKITGNGELEVGYHVWSTIAIAGIGLAIGLILTPAASFGALFGAVASVLAFGLGDHTMLALSTIGGAVVGFVVIECWKSILGVAAVAGDAIVARRGDGGLRPAVPVKSAKSSPEGLQKENAKRKYSRKNSAKPVDAEVVG